MNMAVRPCPAAKIPRPMMRYHGGKWRLASWVMSHFPPHRCYVEPFGGAASVLLKKPRAFAEIYNDLDDDIVNVFRIMRDPEQAARLKALCELTPFARAEFDAAYVPTDDPLERARRILVRSWMGHGASGVRAHRTGFRVNPHRQRTTAAGDWQGWPRAIDAFCERLRGVVIEKRPAAQVIQQHDRPDTLFYIDPPYMFGTRSQKRKGNDLYHGYNHELTDDDHLALLDLVVSLQGMVVLSGYAAEVYEKKTGLLAPRRKSRPGRSWQSSHRSALDQSSGFRTAIRTSARRAVMAALQSPWLIGRYDIDEIVKIAPPPSSFFQDAIRASRRHTDEVIRRAFGLWVSELEPELMFRLGETRPFGVTAKGHGTPYIDISWDDNFYMTGEPIRHVVSLRATIATHQRPEGS